MCARAIKLSGEGVGEKHSRRADVGFYCQHCAWESRAHERLNNTGATGWVLTSVSCGPENNHGARKWRKGWIEDYSHFSPLFGKWKVFTSVKFLSILSGYLLSFQMFSSHRPANGCCLRNISSDYTNYNLMRTTCCWCDSMKLSSQRLSHKAWVRIGQIL